MKCLKLVTLLLVACFTVFPIVAKAQASYINEAVELREAAITSTSAEISTATLPQDVRGVVLYVNFTKGSLTNAIVSVVGAIDGNPAASGYYEHSDARRTYDTTGNYSIYVPRREIGAYKYWGVRVIGTGTVTSSEVAVSYKFDYGLPVVN